VTTQARAAYRDDRRKEAKVRNEKWDELSNAQQLAALDKRLGKDVGATRQRRKLRGKV